MPPSSAERARRTMLQGGFGLGQRVVVKAGLAGKEDSAGTLLQWLEEEGCWEVGVEGDVVAVTAQHLRLETASGGTVAEEVHLVEEDEDFDETVWRGRQEVTNPSVADLLQVRYKGSWMDAVVVEFPVATASAEAAALKITPPGSHGFPLQGASLARVVLLDGCVEAVVPVALLRRKENHAVHERRLKACALARRLLDSGRKVRDKDVLEMLRTWAFVPNPIRKNVIPLGESWVYSDTIGVVRSRCQPRCVASRLSSDYPDVFRLMAQWAKDRGPRHQGRTFPFTSININFAYAARVHRDRHNMGPSLLRSLGSFSGGSLGYFPDDDGKTRIDDLPMTCQRSLNTKAGWRMIDGKRAHCVERFKGERFSVVFFTCGGYRKASAKLRTTFEALGAQWPTPNTLEPLFKKLGTPRGYEQARAGHPSKRRRLAAAVEEVAAEDEAEAAALPSAPAASPPEVGQKDASPMAIGQKFKLLDFPHLELNLKPGNVYTMGALVKRCKGDLGKLTALRRKLQDHRVFLPVD